MDVADDVEGTVIVPSVVPQRLAFEGGRLDLLFAGEHEDPVEALSTKPPQRPAQLRLLVAQHVRAELSVRARSVAVGAHPLGHVEDDGHGQDVVLFGQADETASGLDLDVGGVDDREAPGIEALPGDEVQHVEGGVGGRLVVLVVADQPPTEIGREHLGGQEVAGGEGRLARPGHADEGDERRARGS